MIAGLRQLLPSVIVASVLAAGAAVAAGGESPLRTILVLWFLLVCPGAAVVVPLGLDRGWAEAALALGLSVAIDTVVAGALFYLGLWSPGLAFGVLAAFSLSGAAVAARRLAATPDAAEEAPA